MNLHIKRTKLFRVALEKYPTIIPSRLANQSTAKYCADAVKKYDYENFVCTLLLQNATRSCAFAVRSFNIEIAQVAEHVSQETIGQMRLKFWEETLEKCLSKDYKSVPKHPIAQELFKANSKLKLTKRYLHNLINSRKKSLGLTSFNSVDEMEKYVEHSVCSIYYLILESSGIKNVHADHAASHLGKSQGIVQQLRSIPHARRLNFLPIPLEILIKNKVSQEDVLRANVTQQFTDCIFEFASRAHQHILKARSLMDNVPKEGRSVLLPATPVVMYLDRLQSVNYNVFHPSLQTRSWKLLPKLWITNFRNKY